MQIARWCVTWATFSLVGLAACAGPRRPEPPPRLEGLSPEFAQDTKALGPYLAQYPLGADGRRMDLLASNEQRSMHLVQTNRAIPAHYHPRRTEIAYVLTGRGTVYVEGRPYPAAPGAAFKVAPGRVHSVHPDEGETLVAVVYYEPPMLGEPVRVIVDR